MPQGELNGWSYAYDDEGSGPAIVMLHGVLMNRTMWDRQIDAFRGTNRVIAIDAPGHGGSAGVEVGIDFWRWADMVCGVLDQLGVDQAIWCGQSMGGFTALRAALASADRVAGLILIDTQAHSEDEEKRAQYEALLTVAMEDGISEDLATVVQMILFSGIYAAKPGSELWRKKLMEVDVPAAHGMIRAVFDRDDVHDRLSEIDRPTVVIHGLEDVAIEPERAEEVARLLKAPYVPIAGAGHASPVEEPDAINAAVADYLARL
ncbi:MAG: alpha/beta fold hydrolase [Actinomycetota bacterium]